MSPKEIAEALVEWAVETIPALEEAYDHATAEKAGFPDIAIEFGAINHADSVPSERGLPFEQTDQVEARTYQTFLVLVVAPDPAQAAADNLYEYAELLADAARGDVTLGGRVPRISRRFSFDFHREAPFLLFDDGSKGRHMTMQLVVSDPITN